MQILIEKITEVDFLTQEVFAAHKSEYHDGEVLAMAGASENHNLIVSNVLVALGICLKGKKCKIYPSDMLLHLAQCRKFVYPDLTLVCQEAEVEKNEKGQAEYLRNPEVVIEVLSKSTGFYDKNEKRRCYFMLDSLEQYIMVDSEKKEVISYTRTPKNNWLMDTLGKDEEKVKIKDCEVSLEDIYEQVVFVENT